MFKYIMYIQLVVLFNLAVFTKLTLEMKKMNELA